MIATLLTALIGIAAGAVVFWLASRGRESAALQRGRTEAGAEIAAARERISAQDAEATASRARISALESQLETERRRADEQSQSAATLASQVKERTERLDELRRAVSEQEQALTQLRRDLSDKASRIAQTDTLLEQERKQSAEKLALLVQAKEQLKTDFENLASRIFEDKSQRFADQNKTSIDALLSPLREQIGEFRKRVDDVYTNEAKDRQALFHQIKTLSELNQQVSRDAVNLTNALKVDPKLRGNWGELALTRVLEMSGLEEGREYHRQVATVDTEGDRYFPDVVVHLPESKDVIIDSKVTLVAYEQYSSAETDEQRATALAGHLAMIRARVKELSDKKYDQLEGVRTLDYVLLFVPIEGAFLTAIREDPELFRDAFGKSIILVCPSTLLVTLRTIANIWRFEYQSRNAQTIAKKAADLHDKFATFAETFLDVGKAIDAAAERHKKATRQLAEGPGNLVKKTLEFRALGVKGKKELPAALLELSVETGEDDTGETGSSEQ